MVCSRRAENQGANNGEPNGILQHLNWLATPYLRCTRICGELYLVSSLHKTPADGATLGNIRRYAHQERLHFSGETSYLNTTVRLAALPSSFTVA